MLAAVLPSILRLRAKFHPKFGALKTIRRPRGCATALSAEGLGSAGLARVAEEDTSDAVELGSGGTWSISCSRGLMAYFSKSAALPYGEALTSRDEESGAVGIGAGAGVGTPSFSRRSASSYAAPAEGPISCSLRHISFARSESCMRS